MIFPTRNKLSNFLLNRLILHYCSCTKNNYITEANAGFVSKAEDYKSLARNILKLIHLTDEERNQYGKNGRKFVIKNFLYENLSIELLNILNEVSQ